MNILIPLTEFATQLTFRWRRQLLVAILALLFAVLVLGVQSPLAKTLFIVHLGLFMLWQPFVRADQQMTLPMVILILLVVTITIVKLDAWFLTLWVALLGGVVGGKIFLFEVPWSKFFYLTALFWLMAALVLLALPMALPAGITTGAPVRLLGIWLSPMVFALMLLVPGRQDTDQQSEAIDFVYSVIVVLMLAVLVLGSLAIMLLMDHSYLLALLETVIVAGAVLMILGWIWNPHSGLSGMGTVFSRYQLSVGLPVEQWLHTLADLALQEQNPNRFVALACQNMVRRLPWVTGVAWQYENHQGSFGVTSGRASEFAFEALTLRIYTRYPMNPSLAWHFNLLAQLIAEFRADKVRAEQLKRMTYVEAIHTTGARLTHDIKNLLQSLQGLCVAAQMEMDTAVSPAFVGLLKRQLPALTRRLAQTMDKLQAPNSEAQSVSSAENWWSDVLARYADSGVDMTFEGDFSGSPTVPVELFNHAIENLLANAFNKRAVERDLRIAVCLRIHDASPVSIGSESTRSGVTRAADQTFQFKQQEITVEVSDNGSAIPAQTVEDLFVSPVASETGMGIGLFQTRQMLQAGGLDIRLEENRDGRVTFSFG